MNKWLQLFQALIGVETQVVPLFVHNPQSGNIAAVIIAAEGSAAAIVQSVLQQQQQQPQPETVVKPSLP